MKGKLFLLLIFLSLGFCLDDTPVLEVSAYNLGLVDTLMNNSGIELEELGPNDPVQVDMRILTVVPAVGNRIPPETEGVLWGSNEINANGVTIDYDDGDECNDRYTFFLRNSSRNVSMYFSFRNQTLGGEIQADNPLVEIPFEPSLLETANGSENLTVELIWDSWYYFEKRTRINNMVCVGEDCDCDYEDPTVSMINVTSIGNTSREFIIESGEASFFLLRPVLGEQWYQNNQFDTLIFSRKGIYKAEITMDGEDGGYAQVHNFSIYEDPLGVQYVIVNRTQNFENATMVPYDMAYWATPVAAENNSFSHLYEVNYSYVGWGPHTLNITVTDYFGGTHSYQKEIYSRKMAVEGISETGEFGNDTNFYRPSAPEVDGGELSHNVIPTNQFVLLFLVAAIGIFWYYKGRGKSR